MILSYKIKQNKGLTFFLCVSSLFILYFIYHTFSGNYGLISYFNHQKQLAEKQTALIKIEEEVKDQKNKVNKLKTNALDLDLLDEKSREILGTAKKNEIIIYDEDIKELKNKK